MGKNLDPNIKPEKQHANAIRGSVEKPHIGHGRAGLRRRSAPINKTIILSSELSQKIPWRDKNRNRKNKPCKFHRSNAFHKQCR